MDERKVAEIAERVIASLQAHGIAAPSSDKADQGETEVAGGNNGSGKRRSRWDDDAPIRNWRTRKTSSDQEPKSWKRRPSRRSADECLPPHRSSDASSAAVSSPPPSPTVWTRSNLKTEGIHEDPDEACEAARQGCEELGRLGFNIRAKLVDAMRAAALQSLEEWSREAVSETGMGRVSDKIEKNRLVTTKTPGPEIIGRPDTCSGTDGLTATETAPFGVIASIIPCTNSTETVVNNGISFVASGNGAVFNPHPIAKRISNEAVRTLNRAIAEAGGPKSVLCSMSEPTVESAQYLMKHERVRLVVVTGGGAVVREAMASGKRAICAGPGNPPAVVDETADLKRAAADVVMGASLDNNIICIDEKVAVAAASIADDFKSAVLGNACAELKGADIDRLTEGVLAEPGGPGHHGVPRREFVGKNASEILRALGIQAPGPQGEELRLVVVEVPPEHPLAWTEQLMPVLPLIRLRDAEEAMAYAVAVEEKRRHSASIHTRRIDRITEFARMMDCSICVNNAPNCAGLGLGGEGYTSFSIASATGEGMTTARTFTRERRLALCAGALQIVSSTPA